MFDRYVRCVGEELRLEGKGEKWETVYFGGGTPSLLGPERVGKLLDGVRESGGWASDAEVTLEMNPETVGAKDFTAYREAGVNRVSVGVQSFRDDHLALLGRIHDARRAREAVQWALEGGFQVSLDLIYGLPGQTPADWKQQLESAADTGVGHISAYELTLESGTAMHAAHAGHKVDEEYFFATHEIMEKLGFEGYEVSSFARTPEQRSRHNLATWGGQPYLGPGAGAHSFLPSPAGPIRRWNLPDVTQYIEAVEQQRTPPRMSEKLTPDQRLLEILMLGLRTRRGVDLDTVASLFPGKAEELAATVAAPRFEQLVAVTQNRLCPTLAGMAQADGLAVELSGKVSSLPLRGRGDCGCA